MKSSELHRKIKNSGWEYLKAEGSHYLYRKDGLIISVPYHGAKEVPKGTERKIIKQMKLKL